MKIVIFGLARSGTTALFYKIKTSLPPHTVCLFEPLLFDPRAVNMKRIKSLLFHRREPDVLAKVLPFRPNDPADTDSFSVFDKQILIVRDPRDRLISRLLYGVYHSDFCRHDDKVKTFLEALEQKEADSRSVPVKILLAIFADLNGEKFSLDEWVAAHSHHAIRKPLDFHNRHQDMFLFKYEDLVDQKFGCLEEYLGLTLNGKASVAAEFSRVTRTKGYGGWRDWLTPEDVEYLRPVLQPFLNRFYPKADWELSPSPLIPAEYSSRYVERIVNDRRASLKLPRFMYARRAEGKIT